MLKPRRRCHLTSILCIVSLNMISFDGSTALLQRSSFRAPVSCHVTSRCSCSSLSHRRPAASRIKRTSASMSSIRTYDASELQLQRFIGELGFVEITDWCAVYHEYNVCSLFCSFQQTRKPNPRSREHVQRVHVRNLSYRSMSPPCTLS